LYKDRCVKQGSDELVAESKSKEARAKNTEKVRKDKTRQRTKI
jgi:hypothetical protein